MTEIRYWKQDRKGKWHLMTQKDDKFYIDGKEIQNG